MELVLDIIVFIIKTLIKIGDFIIHALFIVKEFIKRMFFYFKKMFSVTENTEKRIIIDNKTRLTRRRVKFRFFYKQRLFKTELFFYKLQKELKKLPRLIFRKITSVKKSIFIFFSQVKFILTENTYSLARSSLKRRKMKKYKKMVSFPTPFTVKFKYFFIGTIFSLIFIFVPVLLIVFLTSIPSPNELTSREIAQTTKIYDRNGILLYQIYANQNRTLVPLSSIPRYLKEASIAIEDKDFYNNPGFDIMAITRAAIADLSGEPLQGGSTITQQLIKSTLLTPEKSISRKVKEVILAFWSERIYSKDQILEMYLNQVPYGGTAWGVGAASEVYFGKHVKDISLAESAFLAGLPRAPSIYTPYGGHPDLWKKRQKEVLARMKELGYVTEEQRKQAEEEQLVFLTPQTPIYAPHFVMHVKDFLIKKYGLPMVEKGGLAVTTSLDLKLQDQAQKIVTDEVIKEGEMFNFSNAAALITNPKNGDILAMVGSENYDNPNGGNVNLTTSLRQPGSSIKIVTYSAALSNGFTSATILDDSPITYTNPWGSYSPVNYDGRFHGRVPLRIAFANSFNIPAVKTLNKISIPIMIETASKMGITTWNDPGKYGLSLTLGAAETKMTDMATVYGTVANSGRRVDLNPIIKITDYRGNIIEEKKEVVGKQVLDEGIAFIISNILSDNKARSIEFGINSALNIPNHTVSVKTGTSDNKRDNWTFGFTPSFVVGVWVGNNNNQPMNQTLASGITGAAPIWNQITTALLSNSLSEKIEIPENIVTKPCNGYLEYFVAGTENSASCNFRFASPSARLVPSY
ncbi:MAG: transglycosylase domain-containing protein [Candidatus Levyibacteriota bacterium]